jgi:hypothetical protein
MQLHLLITFYFIKKFLQNLLKINDIHSFIFINPHLFHLNLKNSNLDKNQFIQYSFVNQLIVQILLDLNLLIKIGF